jgi:hypothetical protein
MVLASQEATVSAVPEAQAREWTRQAVVRKLAGQLAQAAGDLERGIGPASEALANPLVDDPALAEPKGRLLGLLRDAGTLLVLPPGHQPRAAPGDGSGRAW